jgi:hypothetical protein
MDGGIEQNPAYGAALTFDLQQKCGALLLATEVLTPCSTPTGLARISFGGWRPASRESVSVAGGIIKPHSAHARMGDVITLGRGNYYDLGGVKTVCRGIRR